MKRKREETKRDDNPAHDKKAKLSNNCKLVSEAVWGNICSFLDWKQHVQLAEVSKLQNAANRSVFAWRNKKLEFYSPLSKLSPSTVICGLGLNHKDGLQCVKSLFVCSSFIPRPDIFEVGLVAHLMPNLMRLELIDQDFSSSVQMWRRFVHLQELTIQDCSHCDVFGFLPYLPELTKVDIAFVGTDAFPVPKFLDPGPANRCCPKLTSLRITYDECPTVNEDEHADLMVNVLERLHWFPRLVKLALRCYSDPEYLINNGLVYKNLEAMRNRPGLERIELFLGRSHYFDTENAETFAHLFDKVANGEMRMEFIIEESESESEEEEEESESDDQ